MNKKYICALSILAAFYIACGAPYLYADDMEDNVERLYAADFETHPTSLGGKIHVYGSAIPWPWQDPGDNFSWW